MNKKKAKLMFKHNSFDIIEEGDFVLCAVSGKEIDFRTSFEKATKHLNSGKVFHHLMKIQSN